MNPVTTNLLLQKRDEEVDAEHGVLHNLILLHVDVPDRDAKTQHLLQLEFDGRSDLEDFSGEILRVGDGSGEFAGFRKTRTEKTVCQLCQ